MSSILNNILASHDTIRALAPEYTRHSAMTNPAYHSRQAFYNAFKNRYNNAIKGDINHSTFSQANGLPDGKINLWEAKKRLYGFNTDKELETYIRNQYSQNQKWLKNPNTKVPQQLVDNNTTNHYFSSPYYDFAAKRNVNKLTKNDFAMRNPEDYMKRLKSTNVNFTFSRPAMPNSAAYPEIKSPGFTQESSLNISLLPKLSPSELRVNDLTFKQDIHPKNLNANADHEIGHLLDMQKYKMLDNYNIYTRLAPPSKSFKKKSLLNWDDNAKLNPESKYLTNVNEFLNGLRGINRINAKGGDFVNYDNMDARRMNNYYHDTWLNGQEKQNIKNMIYKPSVKSLKPNLN